jgi:hypothetical protein
VLSRVSGSTGSHKAVILVLVALTTTAMLTASILSICPVFVDHKISPQEQM